MTHFLQVFVAFVFVLVMGWATMIVPARRRARLALNARLAAAISGPKGGR